MPKPENQPTNEPDESGKGTPAPPEGDGGGTPAPSGDDEGIRDKHDEPAINRGRYDRDMRAKDERIAELERQLEESGKKLEESGKKAKSGEEAIKQIEALKAELADEKVTHALEAAGCVNTKAAKALLDDYKGDISKLKADCPYLFKKQQGSTGGKPGGAPTTSEERRKRAAEAAAGKIPKFRR